MNRLALVTGGTTGIGAAICKELKTAGYKVAANYVADSVNIALPRSWGSGDIHNEN